jgi:hypothetical protein
MTKYILSGAVMSAMLGVSILGSPIVTHAAVTDAQVNAQAQQTEQSIVTTLTNYLNFLQLREIQQLQIKIAQLQAEVAARGL